MVIKRINSSASLLLAGNLLSAIYFWVVTSILARQFGIALLGQYTLALSIITPFFCFIYFGFRTLLVTDVNVKYDASRLFKIKHLLSLIFITFLIVFYNIFYSKEISKDIFYLLLLFKILDTYYDFFIGMNYRNDNARKHGSTLLIRSILFIILFIIGSFILESYRISFVLVIISSSVLLYIFDIRYSKINFKFNKVLLEKNETKELFKRSFPIVASAFVGSVLVNVPNYYIAYFYDSKQVGFYSIFYAFNTLINIVLISLGQIYLRKISQYYEKLFFNEINSIVVKVVFFIIGFSILASLVTLLTGDFILKMLFGNDALYYAKLFPYLFLFSIPIYLGQFLSYVATGVNQLYSLIISSSVCLLLSLACGYIFIPIHPIWGSYINYLIVGLIQSIIFIIFIRRAIKHKIL